MCADIQQPVFELTQVPSVNRMSQLDVSVFELQWTDWLIYKSLISAGHTLC